MSDVEQRALVSDQLLSAADGMLDALVDSAISVLDVDVYTGATGLPYPAADDSLKDMLRYERLRRAVADLLRRGWNHSGLHGSHSDRCYPCTVVGPACRLRTALEARSR